jgi:hypothetical protein
MSTAVDFHRLKSQSGRWRARRRFLLATMVLAVLYVGLQELWLWGGLRLQYIGWTYDDPRKSFAAQAAKVIDESKGREAALSPLHPSVVFGLGLRYGYLNDTIMQAGWPQNGRRLDSIVSDMKSFTQFLGMAAIGYAPMGGSREFLTKRLEEDAGGVADRLERVTSPRLRHLFMLGVHAGVELSRLELLEDTIWPPPGALIGMHGTLADVPEHLWRPLSRLWRPRQFFQGDKNMALANYRDAVKALEQFLEPTKPIASIEPTLPTGPAPPASPAAPK